MVEHVVCLVMPSTDCCGRKTLLLQKRCDSQLLALYGGKVKEQENIPQAAAREAAEELGIHIEEGLHIANLITEEYIFHLYLVNKYTRVIYNKEPLKHLYLEVFPIYQFEHRMDQIQPSNLRMFDFIFYDTEI